MSRRPARADFCICPWLPLKIFTLIELRPKQRAHAASNSDEARQVLVFGRLVRQAAP